MARYELTDEFVLLDETTGIVVNISNTPVELSSTGVRSDGIILYPQQRYTLAGTMYAAREAGATSPATVATEKNARGSSVVESVGDSTTCAAGSLNAINETLRLIYTGITGLDAGTISSATISGSTISGDGKCILKLDAGGVYMEVEDEEEPVIAGGEEEGEPHE